MADKKISALTGASTPLAGTEVLPIVQSGSTVKVSAANVTAGRDTSFKTGLATPRNGAKPTTGSVVNGLSIFNDQDNAVADGVAVFLDHSFGTPGAQTRGVKLFSYGESPFSGQVSAKLQVTSGGAFVESMYFKDTGDVQVTTGNLIQGTAAKGINFTANTPAAGMTSQLLNWYEEGTWTPADGSGAGLTFTGATGHYTRIGRQVTAAFEVTYPTTANGNNARVTLPFTAGAGAGNTGFYVTLTNAGFEFTGITVSNNIQFYDNALVVKSNANFSGKLIRGVAVYFV